MDNQEDLASAALIEESVHKILYEATFYKGLGAPKVDTVVKRAQYPFLRCDYTKPFQGRYLPGGGR